MPQVLVLFLCMTIFGCFVYELAAVKPVWLDVAKGFIPTPEILTNTEMLYTAIGIVGEHPPHPSGPCLLVAKALMLSRQACISAGTVDETRCLNGFHLWNV